MAEESFLESFDNLLQVVKKIQQIIENKEFTPSLCHAKLFNKVSTLLLGSCGYPTPFQVHKLQTTLAEFFQDHSLVSNDTLSQKLKTLIEIAPTASFRVLSSMMEEIDAMVNSNKSCKTLLFNLIDKGELFLA